MAMRMFIFASSFAASLAVAQADPVTLDTFVRAETDAAIKLVYERVGLGKFMHVRAPTSIEDQPVIRMNRDTLYSTVVLDLDTPATITLPDVGGRYMGLLVISQDHYMTAHSGPGTHELTKETVGSRYAYLIVRTFVDANDPDDVAKANLAQDSIKLKGGGGSSLDLPDWNHEHLVEIRQLLNKLSAYGVDAARAYGAKSDVDPVHYLVGAASGWGGLPAKEASYEFGFVEKNDGTPYTVTVRNVPVDEFWSITVYNAQGYIEKNELGIYSFNNITAKPNDDGSFTINFGKCEDGRINCLPISEGWNYAVRLYKPRQEILDGAWTFPKAEPAE